MSAERSRTRLWVWPAASAAAGFGGALSLARIRPSEDSWLASVWPADVASSASVLQATATSVMTATALTFSVTVVALQLASQQFSPRLLREFGRDPATKAVLTVLAASFIFSITTLSQLSEARRVPIVAVMVGFALGAASLGAILGFITHVVKVVRVDTMMLVVHDETNAAISRFYPPYGEAGVRSPAEVDVDESTGVGIAATRGGFVQMTAVDELVRAARDHDALVRLEVRAGDHVVEGTPLATAFPVEPGHGRDLDATAEAVRSAVLIGYERTMDQDTGFGLRQLEDVAVKAMSPSVNDPVTAAHAVGHMAGILVRLAGCRLGPTLHVDHDGVGRAIVPDRDLRYYLDLACGQLRRFARAEPSVLMALLAMLRDVAVACRDEPQRDEVRRAAALVVEQMADAVLELDADAVRDMRRRVELALAGDVREAYHDRVGETRST
ncbi:MAG: DUF2254 domain-containing protein [Acidimicrobiales bacterium]